MPLLGAIAGRERDDQLWGSGRGAIAGCHCRVLWLGKVTTNFGGVDVVPLQGAIVWRKGRVTANFGGVDVVPLQGRPSWGSGRGAIAGCHCSVLRWGKGRVTANFAGVDVVPLEGAICYGWVPV